MSTDRRHRPLLELRESLGLSQSDIASVAGCSVGRVSQVENGHGNFSVEAWLDICERWRSDIARLGYSHADFMGWYRRQRGAAA